MGRSAKWIIRTEYSGAPNFMTPRVHEYGFVAQNDMYRFAYEISSGDGIFHDYIVGVSVVGYIMESGETVRNPGDCSQSFIGDDFDELLNNAREYIKAIGSKCLKNAYEYLESE